MMKKQREGFWKITINFTLMIIAFFMGAIIYTKKIVLSLVVKRCKINTVTVSVPIKTYL